MRILFIIPYVPNLIRVRPYNLLVHLAARGHEVTLVTLYSSEKELADLDCLRKVCSAVHAFPLSRWRSLYNRVAALPRSVPLQSVYCWQPQMAGFLRTLLDGKDAFDVIHIEHLRGAKYGLELKNVRTNGARQLPPMVWDSVDCISMLFKQAAGH